MTLAVKEIYRLSKGRKGHSKRIACLKGGKWKTQAFLIKKEDWAKQDPKVKRLVHRIAYVYPKAKLKAVGL